MTRIDLLPVRYHRVRNLARQVYLGLVGLAALVMVLGTVEAIWKVRAVAYERQAATLSSSARQYRTINARFDQLQQAEKTLLARKAKAVPLLEEGKSILPEVQDFTRGLPVGTRLLSLEVALDGKVSLQGEARAYKDVSRFVKWVGETLGYQEVALSGIARGEGKTVRFSVTATKASVNAGGEAE